ncbi:NAD-dependent epimerase/dehydratase family protein [Croceitalea sp. MTPC9]|uniref:NAD-dependent epimerase/dehydratase family protein n=1 Tax=unclassified Croceitalea TaxID=2632280 RepID=UPI002B3CBB3B|nr:NAD-dependent epimerase/dehydratase family protein [Croceitalea sp. MTPC6]GMN16955.1 NAD-dependent epimerase/dehydratase family protein [Croceitalea sp. MTPC9]
MILVTGGTGLVGSHLLYSLAKKGNKIRATYRNEDKIQLTKKVFGYYTDEPENLLKTIEWVKCDINDIPILEIVFDGVNHVYHCAALISFDPKDRKKLFKVNAQGTCNIVNLCIAHNVQKLCYVSSIATIGNPIDKKPADETTEFNEATANVYALSKHQAEMEVWRGSQEGVKAIIVNPGVILGPGFWSNGSGSLFKKIYKGLRFYTQGKTGFVAVTDVVDAMLDLMNSNFINQRYILVSKNLSYQEAIIEIANSLDKKPPKRLLKKWQLDILWRLDWLKSLLTGMPRGLSKKMAESLNLSSNYNSKKIKKDIGFEFHDLDKTIKFCGTTFLEENH